MSDAPEHLTRTEARGASSNSVNRYVLLISLPLVVVLFLVILFIWR